MKRVEIDLYHLDDLPECLQKEALQQESERLASHHKNLLNALARRELIEAGFPEFKVVMSDPDKPENGPVFGGMIGTDNVLKIVEITAKKGEEIPAESLANFRHPMGAWLTMSVSGLKHEQGISVSADVEIAEEIGPILNLVLSHVIATMKDIADQFVEEISYQRSDAVLRESIAAEGFLYLNDGTRISPEMLQ